MPTNHSSLDSLELSFFPSAVCEKENPTDLKENADIIARNALRILTMGWSKEPWYGLISWRVFSAVFLQRDPQLLAGLRRGYQQGFQHVYEQLIQQELTEKQHEQVQLYLSNCLSKLPFADITPHETVSVPQWINQRWTMVKYQVTPIELTPTSGIEALFLQDQDRVFARWRALPGGIQAR